MHTFLFLIVLFWVFSTGCQGTSEHSALSESKMDSELSQPRLPAPAPKVDPGEPQREFEQDVEDAQSL